jgi:hypothetical protein
MKKVSVLISIIVACLIVSTARAADEEQFEVSYWLGPPEKFTTLERYREIKEAGFTIAAPPLHTPSVEMNRKILDLCQQVGLKALIADTRMVTSLDSADARAKLDAIANDYSAHPALYGYFVVDEPGAGAFKGLADVVAYLKEKDPRHAGFINLFPTYGPPFEPQHGTATYEQYVDRFVDTVRPRVLSYDHYPFVSGYDRPQYFLNLAVIRNAAARAKIPFWQICQVVQHYDYRPVTAGELRFQAMQTLAFGGRGLLWYTYWYPGEPNATVKHAMIEYDGARNVNYERIKRINADANAIGDELLRANSWAAYHVGPGGEYAMPAGVKSPVEIETAGKLTVGVFHHPDGRTLAIIANRDYTNATMVRVRNIDGTFDPRAKKWSDATSPLTRELAPGDAVLFRCSRK